MLVLVRLPSLHDNYAYMVSRNNGALMGNCRRIHSKTSFSPVWVFSFVETLYIGSGVLSYGIFGLVGLSILDLDPLEFLLSCSMSVVGLLMVILLLNLVLTFLLLLSIQVAS